MPKLELRPIDIQWSKRYAPDDPRLIPATGADVHVTKQGATVRESTTCTSRTVTWAPIVRAGRLRPGDLVCLNGDYTQSLTVGIVSADGSSVALWNPTETNVPLVTDDRLFVRSGRVFTATSPASGIAGHEVGVQVRSFAPVLGGIAYPNGDSERPLTVESILTVGPTLGLRNTEVQADIELAESDMLLDATGELLAIVAQAATCPHDVTTSVLIVSVAPEPGLVLTLDGDNTNRLAVISATPVISRLVLQCLDQNVTISAGSTLMERTPWYADSAAGRRTLTLEMDASGHVQFFCPEARVDCLVTGVPGVEPYVLTDRLGGWMREGPGVLDVRDYDSIQDAIDALPPQGGTVFIPAGTYALTETLYTPCNVPCHLLGEGGALDSSDPQLPVGTKLVWNAPIDMLRVRGDHSSVRGLTLLNNSVTPVTQENQGRGITIGRRTVVDPHPRAGDTLSQTEYEKARRQPLIKVLIEDVTIIGSPGWGIHIPGCGLTTDEQAPVPEADLQGPGPGHGGTLSFWIDCKRVRVVSARKYGGCFVGGGCTTTFFENCAFNWMGSGQPSGSGVYYVYLSNCVQAVFERCTIEGVSPAALPWIRLRGSENCVFNTCWFEEDGAAPHEPTYFIRMTPQLVGGHPQACRGGAIRDCRFTRAGGCGGRLKLVEVDPDGARGLLITNPHALSADASTVGTGADERYVDDAHVKLGGDSNTEIHVVGAGVYTDVARRDPNNLPTVLPLQLKDVPKRSTVQGALTSTVPAGLFADLGPPTTPPNGNLMMTADLPDAGALSYFRAGDPGDWRLANNAPTLNAAQRDARAAWASGDMILSQHLKSVQVRHGAAWQLANNAPALSGGIRDAETSWSAGDQVLNTDIGVLQVFRNGGWQLWNNVPTLTPEDRDAQAWAAGDMVTTTEVNAAQLRVGNGWRLLNNAPPLTTQQRDLRFDWVNGDLILNTTVGKLQIRVGGVWKSISYS